jgi:hypothetical protein
MTMTLVSPPTDRPFVRIRPAPPLEPPYDDEREPDAWPVCVGQLEIGSAVLACAPPPPPVTGAPPTAPSPAAPPSPESRIAAQRFVGACIEALNGFRPVAHLRPLVAPLDFSSVTDQLTRRAVRVRMAPPRGPVVHRGGRDGARQRQSQVALRRMRVCEPRPGIAEAAAVVAHGESSWAMAVRLERRRGHWLCTLLQVV